MATISSKKRMPMRSSLGCSSRLTLRMNPTGKFLPTVVAVYIRLKRGGCKRASQTILRDYREGVECRGGVVSNPLTGYILSRTVATAPEDPLQTRKTSLLVFLCAIGLYKITSPYTSMLQPNRHLNHGWQVFLRNHRGLPTPLYRYYNPRIGLEEQSQEKAKSILSSEDLIPTPDSSSSRPQCLES
ncbi:hypothetical protein EVAR_101597_1 [Eumeta japonica]|uniref:Uncharacterized protein n=1 Tax=Eumeta variegata TaxID=151549 RepID=A0A4C1TL55_EUMVA|nr:hypothetical protein EVAR_101597_1 [Eumeta japonica]